jgi:ribA/ribD-fused uncharacterized protein
MGTDRYQNRDSKLETAGKIVGFYEREFYCFSNFSSFAVRWKGRLWQTSEHAYQASRFMDTKPKVVEQIAKAMSADEAYRIAQRNKDTEFADYRDRDLADMEDIIRHKLRQNPYVLHKLLQTGKRMIVEDSPKDSFWGWGPDRKGRNELGKLWMKLRDELKAGPK